MILDFGEPTAIHAVIPGADGSLSFRSYGRLVKPVAGFVESSYPREKKAKILNRAPIDPRCVTTEPDLALLRFDRVFAVDTNTRVIGANRISVTCAVLCISSSRVVPPFVSFGMPQLLEHRNVDCPPENLGWKRLIELIQVNPSYNARAKFGLIVDSDLDNLQDYNSQSKPILDSFLLPSNFEMIYASADAGKEQVLNHLIAEAEKYANLLLDQLEDHDQCCGQSMPFDGAHASYFRVWKTTEESG